MSRVKVVAGILQRSDGQVLVADRAQSRSMKDRWEFPGGKIAAGESAEAALQRELGEELGIEVVEAQHFQHIEHDYPGLCVAIDFYLVPMWRGTPDGIEGQQVKWVERSSLDTANLLPADAPVIEALKRL